MVLVPCAVTLTQVKTIAGKKDQCAGGRGAAIFEQAVRTVSQ
jgi:hypothetical protein